MGRNPEKTEQVAADLRVRSPGSKVDVLTGNFIEPLSIRQLVDNIVAEGKVDIVLIAQGTLPDQTTCQVDLSAARDALTINAISPVLFAEAFIGHMQQANSGTLAIIGSRCWRPGKKIKLYLWLSQRTN